jgi:hypothetical protein
LRRFKKGRTIKQYLKLFKNRNFCSSAKKNKTAKLLLHKVLFLPQVFGIKQITLSGVNRFKFCQNAVAHFVPSNRQIVSAPSFAFQLVSLQSFFSTRSSEGRQLQRLLRALKAGLVTSPTYFTILNGLRFCSPLLPSLKKTQYQG